MGRWLALVKRLVMFVGAFIKHATAVESSGGRDLAALAALYFAPIAVAGLDQ
jgi:hypothetical protein